MNDFRTSIAARREAGQTDERIYAELGTPEKAAAELNEQMKEFACRKSPWRFVFLAAAVIGGLWLAFGQLLPQLLMLILTTEAASLGVIGGADGPTAVFVTTSPRENWWDLILAAALLIAGIAGFLRLRRCKGK